MLKEDIKVLNTAVIKLQKQIDLLCEDKRKIEARIRKLKQQEYDKEQSNLF